MANLSTTSDKSKSPSRLTAATEKIARIKAQVEKSREAATMVVKTMVTQGETAAASAVTGFADQKWGADDGTGIRQHVTSGMPTAALAAAAIDLFAGFGGLGEFQRDGFAIASGFLASFASTAGRKLAVNLDKRLEQRSTERKAAAPQQIAPATTTPAAVAGASPAQVAVAVGAAQ